MTKFTLTIVSTAAACFAASSALAAGPAAGEYPQFKLFDASQGAGSMAGQAPQRFLPRPGENERLAWADSNPVRQYRRAGNICQYLERVIALPGRRTARKQHHIRPGQSLFHHAAQRFRVVPRKAYGAGLCPGAFRQGNKCGGIDVAHLPWPGKSVAGHHFIAAGNNRDPWFAAHAYRRVPKGRKQPQLLSAKHPALG